MLLQLFPLLNNYLIIFLLNLEVLAVYNYQFILF